MRGLLLFVCFFVVGFFVFCCVWGFLKKKIKKFGVLFYSFIYYYYYYYYFIFGGGGGGGVGVLLLLLGLFVFCFCFVLFIFFPRNFEYLGY